MRRTLRTLWEEPRSPGAPTRVWRDWALIACLIPTALLEGIFRPDVIWRPAAIVFAVVLTFPLLWRRTHPLVVVAVVFGPLVALNIATLIGWADASVGLYTMVFVVLLPYALLRWGSGREVALGLVIVLLAYGLAIAGNFTGLGDAIGGFVFLMSPALLGASVRYWTAAQVRVIDAVRLNEREQLARELHDTVAHHVSAMVIRAQAGRVTAAGRPEAALEALLVVEEEGSRTLAEMRDMVGALRDHHDAPLGPQRGVADLEQLSRDDEQPRVVVQLTGELDDLRPSVSAAIYRIAQESVTNARRHARHATQITVQVAGGETDVRLAICDDGEEISMTQAPMGYGVVGMTERAALLGGTLEAGPGTERGWLVRGVLPREGRAR